MYTWKTAVGGQQKTSRFGSKCFELSIKRVHSTLGVKKAPKLSNIYFLKTYNLINII